MNKYSNEMIENESQFHLKIPFFDPKYLIGQMSNAQNMCWPYQIICTEFGFLLFHILVIQKCYGISYSYFFY